MKYITINSKLEKYIKEALDFVSIFIMQGSKERKHSLSKDAVTFLQSTVKNKTYRLYRGMGLIKRRTKNPRRIKILNNLQIGDPVPNFILKSLKPYTKKKSIARFYIEGTLSLMIQIEAKPKQILCDLENLKAIITTKQDILDENDFDYFKTDKEVIVLNPIKGKVIYKKGSL